MLNYGRFIFWNSFRLLLKGCHLLDIDIRHTVSLTTSLANLESVDRPYVLTLVLSNSYGSAYEDFGR